MKNWTMKNYMRLSLFSNQQLRLSFLILSFLCLFLKAAHSYAEPINETYIVKSGDVFSSIAQKYQPTGVSLKQVMDEIYANNKDAFVNGNRQQLIVGRAIRIPSQSAKLASQDKTKAITPKSADTGLDFETVAALKQPQDKEIPKMKTNEIQVNLDALSSNTISPLKKSDDDYVLASGDKVHIQVFENPDLTLDVKVTQDGSIAFPLIGEVNVVGLSAAKASQVIADALSRGGFINNPQVSLIVTEVVGSKITLLGFVNKPGVYPLSNSRITISEALASAGGLLNRNQQESSTQSTASAGDIAIISGVRNGQPFKKEISLDDLFALKLPPELNYLTAGDVLYVPAAPTFYIYGEVQKPGTTNVLPGRNVMQAIALSGGLTLRGTQRNIKVFRKNAEGVVVKSSIGLTDLIQADDVLFVEESLF